MRTLRITVCVLLCATALAAQGQFSRENAAALLHHLAVDIGPRPMGSPAEQRALAFGAATLRAYGCDTAWVMPMDFTKRVNTTSGIAVGIKYGATARGIVLGGHMDSAGPEIPGANDDGSGSAVVLECARVLCASKHQSTLIFCLFGGEEAGLEGSHWFVDHFPGLDSVRLMLQADMANGLGVLELDADCGYGKSAPSWLVRAAVEEFNATGFSGLRYPTHFFSINYAGPGGSGSDHESFLERGIPAIDFTTDVSDPIHSPQDNFANFDTRGLQRTGELLLRLVDRFDGGTPTRSLERYWLFLIAGIPIFLPLPALLAIALAAVVLSILAFVRLARMSPPADPAIPKRSWSGVKLWLSTLLVSVLFWMFPALEGLVKGETYPWIAEPMEFFFLMILVALAGFVLAVRLARKLRFAQAPSWLFFRAAVILIIFMAALGAYTPKLLMEPAVGLMLISLAALLPWPSVSAIALLLAPLWPLRLIFSEWFLLLLRAVAIRAPGLSSNLFIVSAIIAVLASIYCLPFAYAAAAVARRHEAVLREFRRIAGAPMLYGAAGILLACLLIPFFRPAYNTVWSQPYNAVSQYETATGKTTQSLSSPDFLKGLRVQWGGVDTTFTSHTRSADFTGRIPFDTSWASVERSDSVDRSGESDTYDLRLTIRTIKRACNVKVTYALPKTSAASFKSPWKVRAGKEGEQIVEWYSFPDTALVLPVQFLLAKGDSVTERIEVNFAELQHPITLSDGMESLIPRTQWVSSHTYRTKE